MVVEEGGRGRERVEAMGERERVRERERGLDGGAWKRVGGGRRSRRGGLVSWVGDWADLLVGDGAAIASAWA